MVFTSGATTYDFSTNSVAYGNRILSIEHHEEPYNDYAYIILKDSQSNIPDLRGFWTEIGYGDTTTGPVNEYLQSQTSLLYVKRRRHVTAQGELYLVLECEGLWTRLEQHLTRLGSAPYFQKSYPTISNETVYNILSAVLTEAGLSLVSPCPVDDLIIDTFVPYFDINTRPYERARGILKRLIQLTKCYLRTPSATGTQFGLVYPQAADAVNLTYNSHSSPYFFKYSGREPVLVPNHFVVYGNRGADGNWSSIITSASPNGVSQTDIDALYEVYHISIAPAMTVQADVNNQAAVRLARHRAENGEGVALIPHDCRVELYDKLAFVDNRGGGTTYPVNITTTLQRVGGLVHHYQPGKYQLEVHIGGVSTTGLFSYDNLIPGGYNIGDLSAEEKEQQDAFKEILKRIESMKSFNPMAEKKLDLWNRFNPPPQEPTIPKGPDKGYWDVDVDVNGMNPIERDLENPEHYR